MRLRLPLTVSLVIVLLVSACSGDDGDESTTTAAAGGTVTTLPGAGGGDDSGGDDSQAGSGTTAAETTTTAADAGAPQVPRYTILSREEGDDGDTVVVLLDPESYTLLTDIDLQNVMSEVVDDFPPVWVAHIIDSEDVADLVLAAPEDVDAEGQRLLDLHYLASLEEGFRITFQGRFSDSGTTVLGS